MFGDLKYSINISRFSGLFLFIFLSYVFSECHAKQEITNSSENNKILILHSYHKGYLWTDQLQAGIDEILSRHLNIDIDIEYFDSKKHYNIHTNSIYEKFLKEKYASRKYDVIIATDDNAFEYALKKRAKLFNDAPIVFTGVTYFDKNKYEGVSNYTGVNEKAGIAVNIELIKKTRPNTKEIIVITDNTVTGKIIQKEVKKIINENNNEFQKISLVHNTTLDRLIDLVQNLKKDSALLYSFFLLDNNGEYLEYYKAISMISKVSRVPIYGLYSFMLGDGIIGGLLIDGKKLGNEAAKKALMIISGKKADNIPITLEPELTPLFDYEQLTKFRINFSLLPEDSKFINKPLSLYEEFKEIIWLVSFFILFLTIAILGITYGYIKSRKTEKLMGIEKERLNITLNSIGEGVISTDIRGRIIHMNPTASYLTGWSFESAIGKQLSEVFRIVNPVTGMFMKNPVEKVLAEGKVVGLANHTQLISKNGQEYQIADTASAIVDKDNNTLGVVLVFRDVTEEYRMRESLTESETTFRSIIEALPMGLHVFEYDYSENLILIGYNQYAENLLQFRQSELMGKKIEEIYNLLGDHDFISKCKNTARTGQTWMTEYSFNHDSICSVFEITTFQLAPKKMAVLFNNITDRKKTVEALKESEKRFRDIAEMLPEVIIETDLNFKIIYSNKKAYQFFQLSEDEIANGIYLLDYLHEKDIERAKDNLKKRIAGENTGVNEYTAIRKDGTEFPILFYLDPIQKENKLIGWRGLIVDISDRKEYENRIRRRLQFEEILYESSNKIINSNENNLNKIIDLTLETIGKFTRAKGTHLYKYSKKENTISLSNEWCADGCKSKKEIMQNIPCEQIPKITVAMLEGQDVFFSDFNNLSDQWQKEMKIFQMENSKNALAVPVVTEGDMIGFIGIDQIGSGNEWDREYIRLLSVLGTTIGAVLQRLSQHKELLISKEKAEESDRLKTEFLAQVSHEIRTPVNAVLSFAGLIKEMLTDEADEDIQESLRSMNIAGRRIMRTIDLIINMSQVQTKTYDFKKSRINIYSDIIDVIIKEYGIWAEDKNIDLEINKKTEDCNVAADEYSLLQIVHNLLDNAIKFTHKGKVLLELGNDDDNNFFLSIIDTGVGITEEYLPHIFEPFSQEEQGYTRRFDGNGLGLALVKKYCDLNNIEISVESKKGEGSKFILKFNSVD